jgi:threonine dehydrogenase-like Zn-dependent dehydrogenase
LERAIAGTATRHEGGHLARPARRARRHGSRSRDPRALPLDDAPRAYEMFQKKADGAVKVLLAP